MQPHICNETLSNYIPVFAHEMQLPLPSAYDRPLSPPVSGCPGIGLVIGLQHENGSFTGVGCSPLQVGVILKQLTPVSNKQNNHNQHNFVNVIM